jgi:nitroreductase
MAQVPSDVVELVRTVRQVRQFKPDPVPKDAVEKLLEVARWTGSSTNTQPWRFVVLDDREKIRKIAMMRDRINWLAEAPLAIAIVMDGKNPMSESYDEGRVTERLLVAARALGLGGGVAWYGEESHRSEAKRLLGIPDELLARQVVAIGYVKSLEDPRGPRANNGRKPLAEIVSYNGWGQSR